MRPLWVAAALTLAVAGCTPPAPPPSPPAVSEVMVATPRSVTVPEYLEVTGRIDAELVVDIRSRITGYLTEVAFRDGQFVSKGDPLYEIDRRPYEAKLASAAGTIDRLVGERRFLEVQVDRYEKLVSKGAASRQEFDSFKAKLEENAGNLSAARADHEAARLNVEFCSITAPIDGQISRTQIQVGNLIAQDTALLATIVSLDPIFVYFNIDEPTFVRMTSRARDSGRGPGADAGQTLVDVGLVDDVRREYPHRCRVDFLNNQLDSKTATITMRGRLDNPHSIDPASPRPPLFRPGMFARIRLPLGDAVDRLFVPEVAVASNQDRKILWIAGEDDIASAQEVTLGQKLGSWVAVTATDPARPLAAADRIVVRGLQRCREGKPVKPTPAAEESLDLGSLVLPERRDPPSPEASAEPAEAESREASDPPDDPGVPESLPVPHGTPR